MNTDSFPMPRDGKNPLSAYSKKKGSDSLQALDEKVKNDKQELGKVYIAKGTEIVKNGGAGVAIRHVLLEIDTH